MLNGKRCAIAGSAEMGSDIVSRHWLDATLLQGIDGLCPDWPAPTWIKALTTLRHGGVSRPPYDGLNLADHVGDAKARVSANRSLLGQALQLPTEPVWLTQVHGTVVMDAAMAHSSKLAPVEADASYTSATGIVCAVLTADCLPLLLCDRQGTRVAAVHAGWRGLAAGVVEATVRAMAVPAADVLVWLGPAIGPTAFEVGAEVRAAFMASDAEAEQAFVTTAPGRYRADLYGLARLRLKRLGIEAVYGGQWCSYSQPEAFYSYRREGVTGRMASLIWISE